RSCSRRSPICATGRSSTRAGKAGRAGRVEGRLPGQVGDEKLPALPAFLPYLPSHLPHLPYLPFLPRSCSLLPGHWIEPSRARVEHHQACPAVAQRVEEPTDDIEQSHHGVVFGRSWPW